MIGAVERLLRTFEPGARVVAACDVYFAHCDLAVHAGQEGTVIAPTECAGLVLVRWDDDTQGDGAFWERTTVDVIDPVGGAP